MGDIGTISRPVPINSQKDHHDAHNKHDGAEQIDLVAEEDRVVIGGKHPDGD